MTKTTTAFCISAILLLIPSCSKDSFRICEKTELSQIDFAQKDLEQLLNALPTFGTKAYKTKRTVVERWVSTITTKNQSEPVDSFYYFNFADSLGYAIYSGDNSIGLLALSLSGNLHQDSEWTSSGQIMMLDNIEKAFIARRDSLEDDPPIPVIETVYGDWVNTFYEPYTGYCSANWGLHDPYNYYSPLINGQKAVAGCVAVATAQLMSMYQYPSYYGSQFYYWSMMLMNPYYAGYDGILYVPKLLYDLGTFNNLDMSYGVDISISEIAFIPRTLLNFGYSSGGTVSNYDYSTVSNELKDGFPVIIGGFSHKKYLVQTLLGITISREFFGYEFGHVWLVHGLLERVRPVYTYTDGVITHVYYQQANYLLCNFGEDTLGLNIGTNANGYYVAGVFNFNNGPVFDNSYGQTKSYEYEGTPNYFQYDLKAVTGIRKEN